MISRPQRLRLVRAVLAGDPDPPVWCAQVQDSYISAMYRAIATHPSSRAQHGTEIAMADE